MVKAAMLAIIKSAPATFGDKRFTLAPLPVADLSEHRHDQGGAHKTWCVVGRSNLPLSRERDQWQGRKARPEQSNSPWRND
jgi:hypothetical protein